MTEDSYRSVIAVSRFEGEKVKGSRFLATVAPLASEADVASLVERLRAEFSSANHHAWAYRLGVRGDRFRHSDDGEPGGSAGRPILRQIDARELTNTLVVVSRIFGGTKLGVGGLIRAYGGAAAEALDRAETRELVPVRAVQLRFPYELLGTVKGLWLASGLTPADAQYGERVTIGLEIPESAADEFLRRLRERTADRVEVESGPGR